jgi:hypothetical protein
MKISKAFSFMVAAVMGICFILLPMKAFSESNNKSILAQIVYGYSFPSYNSPRDRNTNIITIFKDNSVRVFTPNNSNGIYKVVKLPKNKIIDIFGKLISSRITDDKYIGYRDYHIQVDTGMLSIKVYFEGKGYYLNSLLPYFEKQANVVATDKGRHILEKNETKEKYISENASDDYKRFRKAWDQCYNLLDNLYLEITGENIVSRKPEQGVSK